MGEDEGVGYYSPEEQPRSDGGKGVGEEGSGRAGGDHEHDDGGGGGGITGISGLAFVLRNASVTYAKDNTRRTPLARLDRVLSVGDG